MASVPPGGASPRKVDEAPPDNRFGLSDASVTSLSGSISGFAATFAKQPIQRIKWIRQVDAGATISYHEMLRRTVQADGVLGLFRGSVAGIMRNVPHSALVYNPIDIKYPCDAAIPRPAPFAHRAI